MEVAKQLELWKEEKKRREEEEEEQRLMEEIHKRRQEKVLSEKSLLPLHPSMYFIKKGIPVE